VLHEALEMGDQMIQPCGQLPQLLLHGWKAAKALSQSAFNFNEFGTTSNQPCQRSLLLSGHHVGV
jgi:hypothetical protein